MQQFVDEPAKINTAMRQISLVLGFDYTTYDDMTPGTPLLMMICLLIVICALDTIYNRMQLEYHLVREYTEKNHDVVIERAKQKIIRKFEISTKELENVYEKKNGFYKIKYAIARPIFQFLANIHSSREKYRITLRFLCDYAGVLDNLNEEAKDPE